MNIYSQERYALGITVPSVGTMYLFRRYGSVRITVGTIRDDLHLKFRMQADKAKKGHQTIPPRRKKKKKKKEQSEYPALEMQEGLVITVGSVITVTLYTTFNNNTVKTQPTAPAGRVGTVGSPTKVKRRAGGLKLAQYLPTYRQYSQHMPFAWKRRCLFMSIAEDLLHESACPGFPLIPVPLSGSLSNVEGFQGPQIAPTLSSNVPYLGISTAQYLSTKFVNSRLITRSVLRILD
ncbi:hypothetical protein GGS21DRAFT_3174 [Xylaria nigripes]|nr:hypothetical protein GGS21DRAFT_3174 [Xylaria nigripes]